MNIENIVEKIRSKIFENLNFLLVDLTNNLLNILTYIIKEGGGNITEYFFDGCLIVASEEQK